MSRDVCADRFHSSSWKRPQSRALEKGNHEHDIPPAHRNAYPGVQGVEKQASLEKHSCGHGPDLELQEGSAGEDDDPDE